MAKQFEGDAPLLAIAVERGGVLINAHDEANAVLQIFVHEGDTISNSEVCAFGDLRWWHWTVRWC